MLKQLAGHTAIYGLGTVLPRFLSYLLFPYLTRVMNTGEYGVVTDLYALIPLVMVLLTMGLETGFFRFAGNAGTAEEKRNIFANTWGAVSFASVLFFALVLMFTPFLANVMEYRDHPSYIRLVGAIIALDAISAIPFARLRQECRARYFAKLKLFNVSVQLLFAFFFYSALPALASTGGLWSAIYDPGFGAGYLLVANLVATAVTLLALYPACRDTPPRIRWNTLKVILLYSFPLLLSGIAGTANEFIDRQMIKYLIPSDEAMSSLGIYGAVTKLGVILMLFVQMYRYAAEPFFLSGFKKEDFLRGNAKAMKYFVLVSIGIALGILLFSDLFALLMGKDFREGVHILPVVLLANVCFGITLNLSFWYKQSGDTRVALWITGSGLVVTLALNFALVPVLGYYGAALARLGCEIVMVAVSFFLNQKYCRTPYEVGRIGGYFLLGALIYATTLFSGVLSGAMRYVLNFMLLLLFAGYAVRREKIDVQGLVRSVFHRPEKTA